MTTTKLVIVISFLSLLAFFGPSANAEVFEINENTCKGPGDEAIVYQTEAGPTLATCEKSLAIKDTVSLPGTLELTLESFTFRDEITIENVATRLGSDITFLVAAFSARNTSKNNLTLSPNNFLLINPRTGAFTAPSSLALQNDPLVTPGAMGLVAILPPDTTHTFNVVLPCFKQWAREKRLQFGFLYAFDPLSMFRPKRPIAVWELF